MKKIQLLPVFLMMFVIPYQGFGTIRHVPAAYSTIQAGINASVNGDTVLVDPGTYYEHVNLNGRNIKLCSKYLTTGDTAYITSTKIDGSNTGSVITIAQNETSSCQVAGFTIQHGNSTGNVAGGCGGGIVCGSSSPTIHHCNIRNNYSPQGGGGVYMANGVISFCRIELNQSGNGGGGLLFQNDPQQPVAQNCIIAYNTNTSTNTFNGGGGGVQLFHSGKLENCLIIHNSVPNTTCGGAGVYCDAGSNQKIVIIGCTIAYNTAMNWAGTNYVVSGGEFRNCIIWGNTDNNGNSSNYNGSSYVYTCTTPLPSGTGNISSNPNFISQAANNFRLAAGSPCINAGSNTYNSQTVDLDGNPRINGMTIDMGCYEASSAPLQFSVISHIPAKNANSINPSVNVTITFSESLDQSTLTNANIRIFGSQSGLHPAVITYDDATKTVTLNPNNDFRLGEVMEVVVTKQVKSLGGSSLLQPYIWRFFVKVTASSDEFTLSQSIPSPGNALGSIFSDLDNDGDLDAIVTHHDAANADIYSNGGTGNFTKVTTLNGNGLSWATYPPVSGDFDNDGDMDIAIPSRFEDKVCIWRNNGGFSFSAWHQISVHTEPMQISLSDLNGDGYLDMVVNCNNASTYYYDILMNDKSGNFSVSQGVGVPKRQAWQCLGDFDGDGDVDFIGGAQNETTLYFMKNNGSGSFTVSSFPLNSACASSGDFDNDGDLDLIVSTPDIKYLQVLFNNGTGSFTAGPVFGPQREYWTRVINDFNNDGFMDFSVICRYQSMDIYINNGSGTFTLDNSFSPAMGDAFYFDAGDIDNDGDQDMIIPGSNSNVVLVYKAGQLCQTVFTGTGNWSDAARWSNGIPTSSCNATIDGICAVTSSSVCNHLVVKEDRQLTIVSPGITCSEIVLKNGASILGNDKLTLSNPANSKVERYIHGNWDESQTTLTPSTEIHFVSTPVTGAKYNTFEKDALYSWHEQPGSADNWPSHGFPADTDPMQSWHHYIWPCDDNAPEVLDLTNGRGYEVAVNYKWYQNSPDYPCPPLPNGYCECPQDPVFMRYFKGTLNSGDFPVAITYTTGSGNPSYTGWNLVGNPYPSAVDWSLVPKTNLYPNSAAIWNPASGGYVNVVGSGATIPSTQSLFVQASGSGAGVTFNEASRIHNNIPFYKTTITELLAIHIGNAVNLFTDETYVHFDPVSQEGLDELDGRKLDNLPGAPMIWSVLPGDERLCFNTLPSGSAATIGLYFKGGIEADFTLTASGVSSFEHGNTFYLEDLGLEKDTVQNLKSNPSYAFHSRPSDEPARFLLHYGATGLQETGNEPVLIYSYDNYINVSVPSGIKGSINVYTLLGQHIAERSIQPGTINKINMENYQGYALVQVISSNGMTSKKVFIR